MLQHETLVTGEHFRVEQQAARQRRVGMQVVGAQPQAGFELAGGGDQPVIEGGRLVAGMQRVERRAQALAAPGVVMDQPERLRAVADQLPVAVAQ